MMKPSGIRKFEIAAQPPFGQRAFTSFLRGAFWGMLVSLIYVTLRLVFLSIQGHAITFASLFAEAGYVWILFGGLLFGLFLTRTSRSAQDRAFTVAGFLATFFGLGVLVVFFTLLASEAVHWFQNVPALIREENELLRAGAQQSVEKEKAEILARIERDRTNELVSATTDEDKKAVHELFDQEIIPAAMKDAEKNLAEKLLTAERSIRPEPSGLQIFYYFLTSSPSNNPQDAGIWPALLGSLYLGLITIAFAIPVGVGAALYLEEYKQEGWLARLIQVNINNLAGIPSVVYGILGGFVFVLFFQAIEQKVTWISARNLLGGGLTLGLLTLPLVIVSSQEAIRAVPSSLRHGAYALGATKWQATWTIVLPMARPGIMTGTILALSRAMGEAAPLVFFGALQYVDRSPHLFSKFTALPMQIYDWSGRPNAAWRDNAAMASLILLAILLSLNAIAIVLRNRAQKKMRY